MTATTADLQEIYDIVSSIKKIAKDNFFLDIPTISLIRTRLLHLRVFIAYLEDAQDLFSVIDDFIEDTNLVASNYLGNISIKSSIINLEHEFDNFKKKRDLYLYLFHL